MSGYNDGHVWIDVKHLSKFALVAGLVQNTGNSGNNVGNSGSSGGSSSGGGVVGSNENYYNVEARERQDLYIYKDKISQYLFTSKKLPIVSVNITGNENTVETSTMVELLKNTSSLVKTKAPGVVYKNVNIMIGMSSASIPRYIRSVVVLFKVENSWFDTNAIDRNDIKMAKWNNSEWTTLKASEKMRDGNYTYFETQTDSFTSFAIVGLKEDTKGEKPVAIVDKSTSTTPAKTNLPRVRQTTVSTPDNIKVVTGFEAVIGVIAFSIIYAIWRKKKL